MWKFDYLTVILTL